MLNKLCVCFSQVYCETVGKGGLSREPYRFKVAYDKLVIAAGAEPLTFGIKGVEEHAFFLREVNHAQEIRKKLLLNLMLSENPGKLLYLQEQSKWSIDKNKKVTPCLINSFIFLILILIFYLFLECQC